MNNEQYIFIDVNDVLYKRWTHFYESTFMYHIVWILD